MSSAGVRSLSLAAGLLGTGQETALGTGAWLRVDLKWRPTVYPERYQLPQVTDHVLALLERRRPGHRAWTEDTERALEADARTALAEIAQQFRQVAEDPAYWQRVERSVLTVALPRYLRLAKDHHALEQRGFGAWRGGDLVSRAAYAVLGLVAAAIVWRTPFLPKWLEPIPLAFFLFGPLLPDAQAWFAKRRHARALARLVGEMRDEQRQLEAYRPFVDAPLNHVSAEKERS